MLEFDAITHTYRVDGKVIPSVTQIINQWRKVLVNSSYYYVSSFGEVVPASSFEAAADFGSAVHIACRLIVSGEGVDWESIEPSLIPPLRQFQQWLSDYKVTTVLIELPLYSERYDYAGTADLIVYCRDNQRILMVCDIKTGEYALAGPQTAAYEQLYRENYGYKGMVDRFVLYLPKDGKPYTFEKMRNHNDWSYFKAKLYEHYMAKG